MDRIVWKNDVIYNFCLVYPSIFAIWGFFQPIILFMCSQCCIVTFQCPMSDVKLCQISSFYTYLSDDICTMYQYTFNISIYKINTAQLGKIPRVPLCETVTTKFIRRDQSEYEPSILLHYSLKNNLQPYTLKCPLLTNPKANLR